MTTTMKDIAQDLGVSVVTVSKVLRKHSDISAKTRKRVLQRIKELNYQPNPAGQALVTGRTNLVGLIVPDLVDSFFAQVTEGISARLRSEAYGLTIASSEGDPGLEHREIEQMLARRVDALILASTDSSGENVRTLRERNVPYVLLDRKVAGVDANFVGVDDTLAGSLATDHLLDIGCKTVAHIASSNVSTAADHHAAYSKALRLRGLTLPSEYVVKNGHGRDTGDPSGYTAMKQLLQLDPRPDGVFCCNDQIALGAMRAILESGLQIPMDIAVVGCGNVHYDDLLIVPLTSVDQNTTSLGNNAAKLAINTINRKSSAAKTILMPAKVVVRASSNHGSQGIIVAPTNRP